jgi:hypothetical protein
LVRRFFVFTDHDSTPALSKGEAMDTFSADLSVTALYEGCLRELMETCHQAGTYISRQELRTAWTGYLAAMDLVVARFNLDYTWPIPAQLNHLHQLSYQSGAQILVRWVEDQIQSVIDTFTLGRAA